jgi:hypothetical protein
MRVNIPKSKFFAEEIEYLASEYWIARLDIQSVQHTDKAILNFKAPKHWKRTN